jgi:ubiquinone/menaquinone biosynthesis C-methylase UbiE
VSYSGTPESWADGAAFERYVGRWSRLVAPAFIDSPAIPRDCSWLDVGCGTGALSQTILVKASLSAVRGIDRSEPHIASARQHAVDARASFDVEDALDLPVEPATFDAAVSGLVLNFVPEPLRMLAEMARATKPCGSVALYVWDYAGKMEMMRYFWDAAVALQPSAYGADEAVRFPICKPEPLAELFRDAGLADVRTRAIDIPTVFLDFDDYWLPFLDGQGPAPGHVTSLSEAGRFALRDRIHAALPVRSDGSIHLAARAWAVCGTVA